MIPVKICGITSLEDAEMVINYGASAIGMIFYKESPRYIYPEKIKKWISMVPKRIKKVGVFVNEMQKNINTIVKDLELDYIQLHGDESPVYCDEMIKPVIKVFRVKSEFDIAKLDNYHVHAFLFDTYQKGMLGGTGNSFNWDLVSEMNIQTPIILSGGINIENINDLIETVNPSAIDVNSGVESRPGKKDKAMVMRLFGAIENTNPITKKGSVFSG